MIYNLYSSLPVPLVRTIMPDNVLAHKLTTLVITKSLEYKYIHLYEDCGKYFKYMKTVALMR